jgi:DNA replication protein DnaC
MPEMKLVENELFDVSELPPLHAGGKQPLLFIRPVVEQMLTLITKKMEKEQVGRRQGFWLLGSPGTGKSQVGRIWACKQAAAGKWKMATLR